MDGRRLVLARDMTAQVNNAGHALLTAATPSPPHHSNINTTIHTITTTTTSAHLPERGLWSHSPQRGLSLPTVVQAVVGLEGHREGVRVRPPRALAWMCVACTVAQQPRQHDNRQPRQHARRPREHTKRTSRHTKQVVTRAPTLITG